MSESPDAGPATPADGEAVACDPVGAHHVRHRGVRLRRHPRLRHDRGRRAATERARGRSSGRSSAPSSCSGQPTSTPAPSPVTGSSTAMSSGSARRSASRSDDRWALVASAMIPSFILLLGAHEGHRRLRRVLDRALGGRARARGARLDRVRAARVAMADPPRAAQLGTAAFGLVDDPDEGFHPLRMMRAGASSR